MSTPESELTTADEAETDQNRVEARIASQQKHPERYDKKLPGRYDLTEFRPSFVRGMLREEDLSWGIDMGRVLDSQEYDDEEPGALLVYPDEERVFIGRDPTAHNRGDYGFIVKPNDPMPLPKTVDDALDLLKPLGVRSEYHETGELPQRQGEWWLLETDREPESRVFKGGVNERPFGGSPLDNHVPTEFAFGVAADEMMAWLETEYPDIVMAGDSLQDVLDRMNTAVKMEGIEGIEPQYDRPSFGEIRDAANGVFVRGTLRHREQDHYMERIGNEWRIARTHNVTVYTADTTSESAPVMRD